MSDHHFSGTQPLKLQRVGGFNNNMNKRRVDTQVFTTNPDPNKAAAMRYWSQEGSKRLKFLLDRRDFHREKLSLYFANQYDASIAGLPESRGGASFSENPAQSFLLSNTIEWPASIKHDRLISWVAMMKTTLGKWIEARLSFFETTIDSKLKASGGVPRQLFVLKTLRKIFNQFVLQPVKKSVEQELESLNFSGFSPPLAEDELQSLIENYLQQGRHLPIFLTDLKLEQEKEKRDPDYTPSPTRAHFLAVFRDNIEATYEIELTKVRDSLINDEGERREFIENLDNYSESIDDENPEDSKAQSKFPLSRLERFWRYFLFTAHKIAPGSVSYQILDSSGIARDTLTVETATEALEGFNARESNLVYEEFPMIYKNEKRPLTTLKRSLTTQLQFLNTPLYTQSAAVKNANDVFMLRDLSQLPPHLWFKGHFGPEYMRTRNPNVSLWHSLRQSSTVNSSEGAGNGWFNLMLMKLRNEYSLAFIEDEIVSLMEAGNIAHKYGDDGLIGISFARASIRLIQDDFSVQGELAPVSIPLFIEYKRPSKSDFLSLAPAAWKVEIFRDNDTNPINLLTSNLFKFDTNRIAIGDVLDLSVDFSIQKNQGSFNMKICLEAGDVNGAGEFESYRNKELITLGPIAVIITMNCIRCSNLFAMGAVGRSMTSVGKQSYSVPSATGLPDLPCKWHINPRAFIENMTLDGIGEDEFNIMKIIQVFAELIEINEIRPITSKLNRDLTTINLMRTLLDRNMKFIEFQADTLNKTLMRLETFGLTIKPDSYKINGSTAKSNLSLDLFLDKNQIRNSLFSSWPYKKTLGFLINFFRTQPFIRDSQEISDKLNAIYLGTCMKFNRNLDEFLESYSKEENEGVLTAQQKFTKPIDNNQSNMQEFLKRWYGTTLEQFKEALIDHSDVVFRPFMRDDQMFNEGYNARAITDIQQQQQTLDEADFRHNQMREYPRVQELFFDRQGYNDNVLSKIRNTETIIHPRIEQEYYGNHTIESILPDRYEFKILEMDGSEIKKVLLDTNKSTTSKALNEGDLLRAINFQQMGKADYKDHAITEKGSFKYKREIVIEQTYSATGQTIRFVILIPKNILIKEKSKLDRIEDFILTILFGSDKSLGKKPCLIEKNQLLDIAKKIRLANAIMWDGGLTNVEEQDSYKPSALSYQASSFSSNIY